jgi:hypothetical protein
MSKNGGLWIAKWMFREAENTEQAAVLAVLDIAPDADFATIYNGTRIRPRKLLKSTIARLKERGLIDKEVGL